MTDDNPKSHTIQSCGSDVTNVDLQDFALRFEDKIVKPLLSAGFERNKYNVFDILNIGRQELRHSDFLAFLMNPNRSGEVGRQFLRNFLALLSKENPKLHLDFFKVFYGEFEKVIVRREYKDIDILVEIKIQNEQYVFVIENKVDADEQIYDDDNDEGKEGQLDKYKDIIKAEYINYHKLIFLFLSPNKRLASDHDWTPINYNLIYSALCRLDLNTADNTVKTLINDYKKMIRSQFKMEDNKELREKALKIYTENKDIFDFIFTNMPHRVNATADIIREYLKDKGMVLDGKKQNRFLAFRTNKLKDYQCFFFEIDTKDMKLSFYIKKGFECRQNFEIKKEESTVTLDSRYLLDESNKKNAERIEEHEELLLSGRKEEFEDDIKRMLKDVFNHEYFGFKEYERICRKL